MGTKYDFGSVEEGRRRIMRAIFGADTGPLSALFARSCTTKASVSGRTSATPRQPGCSFYPQEEGYIRSMVAFAALPRELCRRQRYRMKRADYWVPKLEANRRRDRLNCEKLAAAGWDVLTVWECELAEKDRLIERLLSFVNS